MSSAPKAETYWQVETEHSQTLTISTIPLKVDIMWLHRPSIGGKKESTSQLHQNAPLS